MKKFRCTVCDYIYEPESGDPESDISSNTAFSDLPDSWRCPVCGVTEDEFVAESMNDSDEPEGAIRQYSRSGLTVIWKSELCNHNGNCTRRLPEVFDIEERPWVDVQGADIEQIKEVVDECPTGALSYRIQKD